MRFRVTREEKEMVAEAASVLGETVSEWVRGAILEAAESVLDEARE